MTLAKRGKGAKPKDSAEGQEKTPAERRVAMTWAQRLNRVYNIDIEICQACGGALRIIACTEDPKILTHLDKQDPSVEVSPLPHCRAPPSGGLFD